MTRRVTALVLGLFTAVATLDASPKVVVEVVAPGGAAANAGVQPDDLLVGWERRGDPAASEPEASGVLATVFDLVQAEQEQAGRGALRLLVRRQGFDLALPVPAGS